MVLADDVKLNEGPSTAQRLKIAEICVLIDVPHNAAARIHAIVTALVRDEHLMADCDIEAGRGDKLQPRGLTDAPQAGKIAAPRLRRHLDDRICAQTADVRKLLDRDCDIVKDHEPLRASWSLQPFLAATALVAEDVLVHVGDAKRLGLDGPGNRLNM